jgi:hypothetical protein
MTDDQNPTMSYPRIMLMVTDNLFPAQGSENSTLHWGVAQVHPLVQEMKIVAIFMRGDGVLEVYSTKDADGQGQKKSGMRDLIPIRRVRLIEEVMPFDIFLEELRVSELGGDEDDDGDDDDGDDIDEPAPPTPIASVKNATTNGQDVS